MSAGPSEDYIKATKLIETFSSFFDKVNTISTNQDLNAKRLSELKKALYQNIHSSDKILTASEDLCTKIPEPTKLSVKTNSRISTSSDDNSQRGELHSSSLSQSNIKARSFAPSPTQSGLIKNETKQIASQDGFGDSLFDKPQLSTEYLPSTSFLALIKAASHSDMSKLFSLTSSYANIRAFSDKQQSVFIALCFSYLETLLKEKSKDLTANQDKDMDVLEAKENEFLTTCKNFTQGTNETDMLKKFYENVSTNPKLYHQAISIFKMHIERILAEKNINIRSKMESFEWMNDVDANADSAFFQGLAQEFKRSLKFLILTSDKLSEKTFSADKTDITTSKKELTIFYDKNSKSAFLLYPIRKTVEDEMESSLYQKTKLKMISGHHHKPPLNSDSLKSLKSLGVDYGGSSLTTLDTVSGSVTSLNDLVEHKETKEKPIQPRILTLSKPHQLRKANTLNVFTSSLNECATSFTYPESAVVRPSTEKIVPPSPHSASKELGYYRSKTYDEEDSLTPKGKEPVPTRPSNFNTVRENSIVDERISQDAPAQNLAQKLSKEVLSNRNFFLDRSLTQEYKRPYMSDSKPKGDLLGKTYSMDFSVGEFTLRRGSEKPSVVRPTVVPIAVKSRLDRFNQTINKNDQEVIRVTNKYLKDEGNTEKGTGLTNLMNSYQTIMNQTKNNNGFRPTIGAALKMDD